LPRATDVAAGADQREYTDLAETRVARGPLGARVDPRCPRGPHRPLRTKGESKVNTRFITNMALAAAGVVIVVASQAFSSDTTGWITFGISLGVLAVLGAVQIDRMRGLVQRGLDAASAAVAVWAAVASVVYSGSTLTWLSIAEGLAFTLIATVGL